MGWTTANLYSLAADQADWLATRLSHFAGWLRGKAGQA